MIIQIEISDQDVSTLENDLLDIEDWVRKAVLGKINKAKKTMDRQWRDKLDADPTVTSIPGTVDERLALIKSRSDFKNRATREEEARRAGLL